MLADDLHTCLSHPKKLHVSKISWPFPFVSFGRQCKGVSLLWNQRGPLRTPVQSANQRNFHCFNGQLQRVGLVVVVRSIHCQAMFLKYLAKKNSRTFVERSASRSKHKTLPMFVQLQIRSASRLQIFRFGTCLKVSKGIFLPPHGGRGPRGNAGVLFHPPAA